MALQAKALDHRISLSAREKLSLAAESGSWDRVPGDTSTTSATSTRQTSEVAWSQTVLYLRQNQAGENAGLRSVFRRESKEKRTGLRVILQEPVPPSSKSISGKSTARLTKSSNCCCCGPGDALTDGQMSVTSAPTRGIGVPSLAPVPRRDRRVSIPSGPAHLLEQMLPANWRKKTLTGMPTSQDSPSPRETELMKAETARAHAGSASYFLSRFQSLTPQAAKGMVAAPPRLSMWAVRAAAKADLHTASLLHTRVHMARNRSEAGVDHVSDESIFDSSSREPPASPQPAKSFLSVTNASDSSAHSSENARAGFVPSPAPVKAAVQPKSRTSVPTLSTLMPSIPREKKSGFPSTARIKDLTKPKKPDLPQNRRNSVEEFMQEIPSLSSIGMSSSVTEGPAVRASVFLSSVDTIGPSMESDMQIPSEMPAILLPPPIGFRDPRRAAGRRVSFSNAASISAPPVPPVTVCSAPMPLVDLINWGTTRLREPQSRRTMVARMRFDKSVPCEMVALLPGGILKVLSGFHLRVQSKTGEIIVTKRLQKKVYRLESLEYIDGSRCCLATAREATLKDSQNSNPHMWDQVNVDRMQTQETCLCLYSQGKTLPCMPVFEVMDDKHDFLELLAINASSLLSPQAASTLTVLL